MDPTNIRFLAKRRYVYPKLLKYFFWHRLNIANNREECLKQHLNIEQVKKISPRIQVELIKIMQDSVDQKKREIKNSSDNQNHVYKVIVRISNTQRKKLYIAFHFFLISNLDHLKVFFRSAFSFFL